MKRVTFVIFSVCFFVLPLVSYATPVVSIINPKNNSVFKAPATITITAFAFDLNNRIKKVDFYYKNNLFWTSTKAPYSVKIQNLSVNDYVFTARVTNNNEETAISGAITVQVKTTLTNPVTYGGSTGDSSGGNLTRGVNSSSVVEKIISGGTPGTGTGGSTGGGGMPTFGGMVSKVTICTCSPGIIHLVIGPPKGGAFLLTPASKIYMNGKPTPGSWVLGDYAPGGVCMLIGKPCYPLPAKGSIIKIGTS